VVVPALALQRRSGGDHGGVVVLPTRTTQHPRPVPELPTPPSGATPKMANEHGEG
jgi:hypothetical protein